MKQIQMEAKIRTVFKKNAMNRLREKDLIPAVMYGQGEASVNLEVDKKEMQRVLHASSGSHALLKLTVNGGKETQEAAVMIKELQRHPVNSEVLHIDFVKIRMDQPLETTIPIVLAGLALGAKEGGMLEQLHRDLALRCLPALLPEKITVDVSKLNIGDAISVAELSLGEGIEVLLEPRERIVHVLAPRVEEEKPAEGEVKVPEEGGKEPEVIGAKERDERRTDKDKGGS